MEKNRCEIILACRRPAHPLRLHPVDCSIFFTLLADHLVVSCFDIHCIGFKNAFSAQLLLGLPSIFVRTSACDAGNLLARTTNRSLLTRRGRRLSTPPFPPASCTELATIPHYFLSPTPPNTTCSYLPYMRPDLRATNFSRPSRSASLGPIPQFDPRHDTNRDAAPPSPCCAPALPRAFPTA